MKLSLSLTQKHLLSQQMQQSVKILQMSSQELNEYIKEAAMENPMIDMDNINANPEDPFQIKLEKLKWLQARDKENTLQYSATYDDHEDGMPLFNRDQEESLLEFLEAQIPDFSLTEAQEKALRYLIGNLDESGYLTLTNEQMAADLSLPMEVILAAMDVLHKMEPYGVGARNLQECLILQLKHQENGSSLLINIIQNHMELLAKNHFEKLAKLLNTSVAEVKKARQQLCTLNPKPGNGFNSHCQTSYIHPDLFILHFQGHYEIVLNDYGQPRIEISSYYRQLSGQADEATATYINNKMKQARWLMSCISQRQSTLLKCAKVIVEKQQTFFAKGPGFLSLMTMADVAEILGVHESTVSRAVHDKYLRCQWGVFPLSDFFSRAVNVTVGQHSQDNILVLIKKIIAKEDPRNPQSDQQIMQELTKDGVKISRRTVAKYREMLQIPPASGRKQY